jgi:hypothetical protein
MLAGLIGHPFVQAQVPSLIRYQGQAVDSQGVPLEGPYTLTFRLYDAEMAGTKLWEEAQPNVPLSKGHFSVLLGSVTALNGMDWAQPCWLSVQVNGDPELAPRQRITSVPLALRAKTAEETKTSGITDDSNRLVPAGAIILWKNATCPAGYVRVADYDDQFLISAATAGATGGSLTHNHDGVTGSHALTVAELPSHAHTVTATATGEGGNGGITGGSANTGWDGSVTSSATGGGNGHTHPIVSADHRPPFRTIVLCERQ